MKRRIIAMLMAIVMLVGNIPFQAFAEQSELQETTACDVEGCTYAAGHEGECSNYVAPVAEPAADAAVYVTVSNCGELGMAYEEVIVSDTNEDGKLSVDEALYAAHMVYGKGYTSQEGMITQLWSVETTNVSVFRNHTVISTDVGAETIGAGDYLVASVDQDTVNDYDKYSRFNVLEKTAKAGESFTLTLTDDAGNALAGMEIGLWGGNGSTTMTGLTTDVNGSVALALDQEGLYCVTAKGTVVESSIDVNTMEMNSIESPIIAPVCVVSVYGTADQAARGWSSAAPADESAEPVLTSVETDFPVSVTADGSAVTMTTQGTFGDKQYWGGYQIPVYYAKVSETATLNIAYNEAYIALGSDYFSTIEQSALTGVTKADLEAYFTTASDYGLSTANSVVYIEFANGDYVSAFGLLIELEPAAVTTYTVELPTGEGYEVAASGDCVSPVEAGGSYSFTVTVADGYDDTNMVVMANGSALTAVDGVYTITDIQADQTVTVTGVEEKVTGPVSVTADGSTVAMTTQGTFGDKQYWGGYQIPVYYAKVSETATLNIAYNEAYIALGSDYFSTIEQSALTGVTKADLEAYFTTASDYGLSTANSVVYIEFANGDYVSAFGLLIELEPAAVTTYTVELPTGGGYEVAASGDSVSPVEAGGSYSFTVTVADGYDDTNMVVMANGSALTAVDGIYTITDIQANQTVTVTGVEEKVTGPVSVTADGSAVTMTTQGTFGDKQYWGGYQIPVYYAKVSETATLNIAYSEAYIALGSDYFSTIEQSALTGVTKADLEAYFTTASDYGLSTANSVAYIEFANGDYVSAFGLLIELEPTAVTTYTVELPTGEGYTAAASGDCASPVEAGGSYSFTVTVADGYDDTNMVVMANGSALTAVDGIYTIENISENQAVTVTGIEKFTYTVTLPTGEGYVAAASGDSESSVEAGGSYSFTVAVVYGYDSSAMKVMANGSELTAVDGIYTIENISENQTVTVTGVAKKTAQSGGYITVSIEKFDTDGNGSVLLNPTRLLKADYVNDYMIPALRQAMGSDSYVKYDSTYADGITTYFVTGIYDQTQDDSYLNNGDLEGFQWQVLVNNEAWSGRDYNSAYKLQAGDVIRCIYTNEDPAGKTDKDALVQLAAEVSAEVQQKDACQDALEVIASPTATDSDVESAIAALKDAMVVNTTSVKITAGESVDLKVNQSLTLQAAVLPANATEMPVWSTSDSGIVSVDAESGQITGVAAGIAKVTVTSGTATDSIQVNVTAVEAESVTITNGDVSVEARFSVQLEATVTPENSTELVVWSVGDESIAIVDANGKLTGVSAGTTTVTATAGSVSHTVNVTVDKTTSSYVYFQYGDGRVQEMKDDAFTLTVLDEGSFVVGNTSAAVTWSCSEYVSNDDGTNQFNYWISSSGKYQPHGVKEMTANVQAGGFYKTFTIKTVPSGISQIKAYIGDAEKNAENPYEVIGMVSGIPVTVMGLNGDGNWVYVPTQAVQITSSNTNVARLVGNQMSLIHEGDAEITVSMMDNSEVSTSFKAVCGTVKVTAIDVVVPETFYIDQWDSMGSVFVGIYKGYEDPDTQYYINYTPSNATNQDVIWEDLTPEIATYDEGWSTGIVPKKAGTAKFKVTSVSNPDVSQEVSINFAYKTPLQSAVSSQETYEMSVGESLDPGLTFTPGNATETRFNWTYSQDGIVQVKETVTSSGYNRVVSRTIIANANGTVTVTGKPVDDTAGCESVTFTVIVGGSAETEDIDYLQMAKTDIAHGLEYLQGQSHGEYGTEWTIFTDLRAGGSIDAQMRILYLQSVAAKLADSENMQPTDYARLVLTLPLLDVDPEDFEGTNLVEKLYNGDLDNQTSNRISWTLLALDSRNYEIPADAKWNRDALIEKILTFQNSDGGFTLNTGSSSDVDITGMVLQSLAPYNNSSYPQVQSAVKNALEYLKAQMTENVGYISGGAENACTAAQVLTALAALKIDPTDPANGFTLGTKNLITNLRSFKQDSGFAYLLGQSTNIMGTQQTTYALEAYRRYAEGKKALYDLTDLGGETEAATYAVTLPTGDGFTAEAADGFQSPVPEGGRFTFTVTLADGYTKDENFAVKANDSLLEEANGKYTITNITADQNVTVEGVRKVSENETFTVSLPTGEGYTAQAADGSESPVEYGGSYVFTVTLAEGYVKNAKFAVEANGVTLTENNGKYTIENIQTDQTVTVTGVVGTITVRFSLLGDYKHGSGETAVHTLADGNLQTWVEAKDYIVAEDSTVKEVLEMVLSQNGMTCVNPSGNYVEAIVKDGTKIGEFTNGSLSGWMYTLNGEHSGLGVGEQKLKDGDVVVFHYTDDFIYEQDKAEANKVMDLIEAIGEVTLDSEAAIAAARDAYYALTEAQQELVTNYETLTGAEIALELLRKAEADKEAAKAVENLIEAIGEDIAESKDDIEAAREAYDALSDTQKALVTNYDVLENAEKILELLNRVDADIVSIYKTTGDSLAAKTLGFGSEWIALGLARSGRTVADSYYESVVEYVKENISNDGRLHEDKSTENSRVILALTAIGKDVTDVGGKDLISGLDDLEYISKQGINGPIWALIALDSHNYTPATGVTRDDLINAILNAQNDDGGWSMSGSSDADMTAMAIQALALYYYGDYDVKKAVDEALIWLSDAQNKDGSFSSGGVSNAESTAQVIVALTALGIDPDTDIRFIKTGITTVQALAQFYVGNGGFEHIEGSGHNEMATEQAYYALTAYARFKNNQLRLYSMHDVTLDKEAAAEVEALINAIGTVDISKGDEIDAARDGYDALTEDQKALVSNYQTLTDAEEAYAKLADPTDEDIAKANAVKTLIDAIGTVTLDSEAKITAARSAYNLLTPLQKYLVGDAYLKLLTDAEKTLAALKQAAADEAAAQRVEYLISVIGTNITLGSEAKITTARNAYNALTATQKTLVSNYQTLLNAESILNMLQSTISVTFTLLGDNAHTSGTVHTLASNNLQTWIAAKTYRMKPGSTVKDLLETALDLAGMTCSNPTGNYVESITKGSLTLGEFTNGKNSGWMYTRNGKHPSLGVAQQTLVDGDVIVFHYTDDYTKEEGSTSGSTGTASSTTNYITTTATQQNTELAEAVDQLIEDIGEEITLDSEAKIKAARAAYDKLTEAQKKLVVNYDILVAAELALAELKGGSVENIYIETGDYLQGLGTPSVGSVGGEWMVIGLARSDRTVPTGYYEQVVDYVGQNINELEQLHSAKSTDNSRLILALTAIGKDVTNVDGHNLLAGLNDMAYIQKQGINGPIWALLAFNSGNYPVPEGDVSRDKLVEVILEAQLADGGWALSGEKADADMTAMAIQALAPYVDSARTIKVAVLKAVSTLSEMQNDNGSFSSVDGPNSESIAQVIVALAALGIDADTDARFVKNGLSALDALVSYYVPGGGFRHTLDGTLDGMATEQAYYALVAYNRMLQNRNFLYDMTDVIDMGGDVIVEETTEPTEPIEEEENDGSPIAVWVSVMALCAAAAAALVLGRKKFFKE